MSQTEYGSIALINNIYKKHRSVKADEERVLVLIVLLIVLNYLHQEKR